MRINQNAYYSDHLRILGQNRKKSMEKLSSGLAINRASDNAAGLSIGIKMNAQVRGISQARRNIMDSQGLLEVAERGLQGVNSSLHRMRELSVQAANDVLTDSDRKEIQSEMDALKKVISSTVKDTSFNTQRVLSTDTVKSAINEVRQKFDSSDIITTFKSLGGSLNVDNLNEILKGKEDILLTQSTKYVRPTAVTKTTTMMNLTNELSSEIKLYTNENNYTITKSEILTNGYQIQSNNQGYSVTVSSNSISISREDISRTIYGYDYKNFGTNGFTFSEDGSELLFATSDGAVRRIDTSNPAFSLSSDYNVRREYVYKIPDSLSDYKIDDNITTFGIFQSNSMSEIDINDNKMDNTSISNFIFEDDKIIITDTLGKNHHIRYQNYGEETDFYEVNIPSDMELYYSSVDTDEPLSFNIQFKSNSGNISFDSADLIYEKPHDGTSPNGIFINEEKGVFELYGKYRPSYKESVDLIYLSKTYNSLIKVDTNIEKYNLENQTDEDKAMRVYMYENTGMKELILKSENSDSYWYYYNDITGEISINPDLKPDLDGISNQFTNIIEVVYFPNLGNLETKDYSIGIIPEFYDKNTEDGILDTLTVVKNDGTNAIILEYNKDFSYEQGDGYITLKTDLARPNAFRNGGTNYKISFITDNEIDEKYQVLLGSNYKMLDLYSDTDGPISIEVFNGVNKIEYLNEINDVNPNTKDGWYYDKEKNSVVLVGSARPSVGEKIQIKYIYTTSTEKNEAFDFTVPDIPKSLYGLDSETGPKNLRFYSYDGVNYNEILQDEVNGYTLDSNNVAFHGESRPNVEEGFPIKVVYSKEPSIIIPEGYNINKVYLNNKEIKPADENQGNGYTFDGKTILLVGSARPDVNQYTIFASNKLEVSYFKKSDIEIEDRGTAFDPYIDQWVYSENVKAEIPLEKMKISLMNGSNQAVDDKYLDDDKNLLTDFYELKDNKVVLSNDLKFNSSSYTARIDYVAIHAREYEDNEFTFQVGPNSGNGMKVSVSSMENILFTTDQLKVTSREYADKTIGIVDKLISQVSSEMGSLGAMQNRLTSASNNLSVLEENTTSAMSRIMDVDYAKEMLNQIKYSILEQAVTALQVHQMSASQNILKLIS